MKAAHRKAYNELKKMGVPVFVNADHDARGNFGISGEDPESCYWVNYYSMDPEWDFGVNPKIDAVLSKHGLFAEWQNPGSLNVYVA